MKDVLEELEAWTARGSDVALATVVGFVRSAPRPVGTKMAIDDGGRIAGAVSGGCVEGAVVAEARRGAARRAAAAPALRHRRRGGVGGRAAVRRRDRRVARALRAATRRRTPSRGSPRTGGRGALVTVLRGPRARRQAAGRRRPRDARQPRLRGARRGRRRGRGGGHVGERPRRHAIGDVDLFVDVDAPAAAAGDLRRGRRRRGALPARAGGRLAGLRGRPAHALRPGRALPGRRGGRGRVAGGGARAARRDRPRDGDRRGHARPEARRRRARPRPGAPTPATSAPWARAARRRSGASACWPSGIAEADLARISAPIGLDLGGITAEETALSILAEIVALKRGHEGGRLARTGGPIHEAAA